MGENVYIRDLVDFDVTRGKSYILLYLVWFVKYSANVRRIVADFSHSSISERVLDLETTKTTQALEIDSLKRRVKKLKRRKRSRTHGLKRLYKVRLSARVESSKDEDLGEEDASKHGRISDIDADEDISLVSTHDDAQMFDVDKDLHGEEVFVAQQDENVVEKEVDAAQVQVTTATTIPTISINEATLAQALTELKHTKPKTKAKWIVFREPEVSTRTTTTISKPKSQVKDKDYQLTERLQVEEQHALNDEEKAKLFMQLLEKRRKFFAKMLDRAFKRINTFVGYKIELVEESFKKTEEKVTEGSSKRARAELEQKSSKKQKIDGDKDTTELQQSVKIIPDEEGIAIDAITLAVKPPSIVDWKIHKEGMKTYYQIIRADGTSKMYLVFSHMLKDFDRKDVETL
nr:hypothetical protein [Tanacetum cinerariifolium]